MTHSIEYRRYLLAAAVCLQMALASGCGYLQSKKCCPVYLPNDHLLGSEAIRNAPCAPDCQFYGLKKTAWREWPAEWQFCQPTNCPPQAMGTLPYAASEGGQPVEVERLQPVKPEGEQAPVESEGAEEPPRRIEPFDLFGPVEGEDAAPPRETPRPLDRIEPAPPSEAGSPASPPQDPQNGSIEPSSWSAPRSFPGQAGVPDSRQVQLEAPSSWLPGPNLEARVNTRAPRPSKFRR